MSPSRLRSKPSTPKRSSLEDPELERNLETDPYQIQERLVRNSLSEDMDEFGKVGAEVSYLQSQMHSDYDSAESIADSDLEDGELRKMLASPLYLQNREDCESSRMPIAPVKPAALLQERGASAKRTQADLRKGLMSSSSQETECTGETCCIVSIRKRRTAKINSRVLSSNTLTRQTWEDLFLKAIKIICSVRAKSELTRQEHQVGSLDSCISELQQHAYAQRSGLQDAQHGYIESRREQVRLQEELSMKEKVLRDTQIRSMHEMGEMKRAQELRVDEVSVKD